MSLRFAALGVLVLVLAFVVVGCGASESVSEDVTPVLAAPPAAIEPTATATVEPAPTEVTESPRVKIPNRGYNSMGSEDAPIVMFDFSDYL